MSRKDVVSTIRALLLFTAFLVVASSMGSSRTVAQGEIGGLPEVDGWGLAPALLAPISEQAVAELNGKIYVIGGYPPGRIPVDTVQVYDVATERWAFGPPIPVAMHHVMAAGVGGKLYAVGGEFQALSLPTNILFRAELHQSKPFAEALLDTRSRDPSNTSRRGGPLGPRLSERPACARR